MKLEEKIAMLKEAKIIDESGLFARVAIIYSELSQTISIAMGYSTQGTDGYVGICEDHLVLFENTLLGGKPKKEVFRVPIPQVELVSLKSTLFGIGKVLRVKVDNRKIKMTASSKHKAGLAQIAAMLQK